MPAFIITTPEGKKLKVTAPEGATKEQALAYVKNNLPKESKKQVSLFGPEVGNLITNPDDVGDRLDITKPIMSLPEAGQMALNAPSSALNVLTEVVGAVSNPIDTSKAALGLLAGLAQKAGDVMPQAEVDPTLKGIPLKDLGIAADTQKDYRAYPEAVASFLGDRYGTSERAKQTLINDPAGFGLDLAGGLSVSGARGLSNAVNPVAVTGRGVKATAKPIGGFAADVIGGLGTHTGGESLRMAARAGRAGGKTQETFVKNMRGRVPMTDVLDTVKSNVEEMGRAKSANYRSGMVDISSDKTVLSFDGIDKAVSDARGVVRYKNQVKAPKANDTLSAIASEIDDWKKLDPAEYHTPEGLDALKQKIGAIVESIPFEEKTARRVAGDVYRSIKTEISNQAPTYAKVMKDYSEATDLIKEIERSLSVGKKSSADTALRKLQSLTRNNVNTNYSNRLSLMKELERQGGQEVMPALAGQSLNTITPRGLGSLGAGISGVGGYMYGGPGLAIPLLAAQSPRLMGEAANKLGQAAGLLEKGVKIPERAGLLTPELINILYQSGRIEDITQ